jgi:NAD(P)H-hydrate epimerase
MIPVLTPAETAELDRRSAERGVTVDRLMENAGAAVARSALSLTGGAYGRRAVVVCGKGNNGGDGLVAARLLGRRGVGVTVVSLANPSEYPGAAARNLQTYLRGGGRWRAFSTDLLHRETARADVVVDAVFGTGFHGRPEGDHAAAISAINEAAAPVLAVDIPSGVEGETGAVRGQAVMADVTVTFGALKPGLVFFPGAEHAGVPLVADIGFPPDLVSPQQWLMERADASAMVPTRPMEGHKRTSGVVLVVAGSRGMTGAAGLVAVAAYRAGAGLVTVAAPEEILPPVQALVPEATFLPLPGTEQGTVAEEAWTALVERLDAVNVVAVGPGMTTQPETAALVRRLVRECPVPVVADADASNAFVEHRPDLGEHRSDLILTPHVGEMARLTGRSADEIAEDRVATARKAAAEFGAVVLLKGSRSVVAEPNGRVVINPTGGPFLATAGTGDVLTGTVAAFVAGRVPPGDAAAVAAYVHGLAGRLAVGARGPAIVATDVATHLPAALRELRGPG